MRSFEMVSCAALLGAMVLIACGGVSSIGSSAGNVAGSAPVVGTGGAKTGGASGVVAKGGNNQGGKTGAGTSVVGGATSGPAECQASEDCPGADEPCQKCAGGEVACNYGYCDSGKCMRNGGFCTPACASDDDCPTSDLACTICATGNEACPVNQCLHGFCQVSYPGCKGFDPCDGLFCGYPCTACPPGTNCDVSVASFCNDAGKCQPGAPACGAGKCQVAADCATPPPACVPCVDGTCAVVDCVNHTCGWNCPTSSFQCKYTDECLGHFDGQPCSQCANGECAVPACLKNACELVCPAK